MAESQRQPWTIEFYRDKRGNEPVKEFLLQLNENARASVGRDISLLKQYGLAVSFPMVRPVEGVRKLWELRSRTTEGAVRIFYVARTGQRFVLLHAFIKKTAKTPKQELAIGVKRLRQVLMEEKG